MTLVCTGHAFEGKSENPWGITSHWDCKKCGLRVVSMIQVKLLTGEPLVER